MRKAEGGCEWGLPLYSPVQGFLSVPQPNGKGLWAGLKSVSGRFRNLQLLARVCKCGRHRQGQHCQDGPWFRSPIKLQPSTLLVSWARRESSKAQFPPPFSQGIAHRPAQLINFLRHSIAANAGSWDTLLENTSKGRSTSTHSHSSFSLHYHHQISATSTSVSTPRL